MTTGTPSAFTRRTFLKGAGSVAALAAGGSLLSGCSSSTSATSLRFFEAKQETVKYFTNVANQYNASQSKYSFALENTTNLVADFVRNTPVDVGLSNYQLPFAGYVASGVMADQTDNPALQLVKPAVIEYAKGFGQYKNEISGIPYSQAAAGVIYNRDLFHKAGITALPTTWTEFLTVCETLKSKGITPILGTWSQDIWTMAQGMFDYFIGGMVPDVPGFFAKLKAQGTDVGPNSEVSFSKDFLEPAKKMLLLNSYYNSDVKNINYNTGNAAFAAGEAAMEFQGPWSYTVVLQANPKINCGMFPLPCTENAADTKAWANLDLILWTPKSATGVHKEGGLALSEYLMRPEIIHAYNAQNLAFATDKAAPEQTSPLLTDMNQYISSGRYYSPPDYYFPASIPLQQYLQTYVFGASSVETFLANLDRDWKRHAVRLDA